MKRSAKGLIFEAEFHHAKERVRERSFGLCESWPFVRDHAPDPDIYHGLEIASTCQFKYPVHVHHRKFRSRGGTNALSNLVHLCEPCHSFVHSHPEIANELRLALHAGESEELT